MVWERQRSPHVPSGSEIGKSKPSNHPLSPNGLYLVEPSSEEPLFHGPLTSTEASQQLLKKHLNTPCMASHLFLYLLAA